MQQDRLPIDVALVGCGKMKAVTESDLPASELYIGNPFKMAFRHAMQTADDVHILSALHGMIPPHKRLAPYDYSMTKMFISDQRKWGIRVLTELKAAYPLTLLRIIFYAGQDYVRPIMDAVTTETSYWAFENPLKGLGLFERLAWFKHQWAVVGRDSDIIRPAAADEHARDSRRSRGAPLGAHSRDPGDPGATR